MNEEQSQKIDDTIENLPPEVSDFIFGGELEKLTTEIVGMLQNDEQKLHLKNDIFFFLLGVTPKEEVAHYIENLPIEEEKKMAIKIAIQEKIINELLLTIEANKELDEEALKNNSEIVSLPAKREEGITPSLANLTARLGGGAPVAPVTRDYSIERTEPQVPSAPARDALADPYHEPVEK